jgi:hypothetical protein
MKAFVCSARNSTVPPERSSSMNVTPPAVPTPGMDGGENAKAMASGICASFMFSSRMMSAAVSPCRSCQGARVTK